MAKQETAEAPVEEAQAEETQEEPEAPEEAPTPEVDLSEEHGNIGESIYAQVETLTKGGAMTRQAAFDYIATQSGRKPGTVAANYYRIARQKEGLPDTPRPRGRRPGRNPSASGSVVVQIDSLIDELQAIKRRVREMEAVQAKLDELRKLVG
jgi:hypothetical protein